MDFDQWLDHMFEHGHAPPGQTPPEPSFFIPSSVGSPQPLPGIPVVEIPLERRVADLADLSNV